MDPATTASLASVGVWGNLLMLLVVVVLWAVTADPGERIPPRERW